MKERHLRSVDPLEPGENERLATREESAAVSPIVWEAGEGPVLLPHEDAELEVSAADVTPAALETPRGLRGKKKLHYGYTAQLEHELGYPEHSSIEVQRACSSCPNPARSFSHIYGLLAKAAYTAKDGAGPRSKAFAWHAWYGVKGVSRGATRWWQWITVSDYAGRPDVRPEWIERKQKQRWIVTGGFGAGALGAWSWWAPSPIFLLMLALVVGSIVERKRLKATIDQPLKAAGKLPRSKVVKDGFLAAKLGEVRVLAPGAARDGNAWTAIVEMPAGITASKAMQKREELAGAFGVGLSQVFLDRIGGHAGRVRITVFDTDPWLAKPVKSPLLSAPSWDVWERGVPIGVDARGNIITVKVFERSVLVGGEPGAGKSVSAMSFLAAVALDPNVQLWLGDGKGVDSKIWEPLAYRVAASADPMALVKLLEELYAEVDRRYGLLRRLDKKKIERSMKLPLIVLWVDELMRYTTAKEKLEDGKTKAGDRIVELLRQIVSLGRAAGVITICATQKPSADVVPTILRDLLSMRLALRCTTPQASDTILGQGWASAGYNAATIDSAQRGAGYLWAEGSEPVMLRSFYFEDADERAIATRAQAVREAAGTLLLPEDHPRRKLMLVILDAFGDDERLHTEDLLARLAAAGVHLSPVTLAEELRPSRVTPKQIRIGDLNRNGYRKSVIETAYADL